jgi:hypothetical protein
VGHKIWHSRALSQNYTNEEKNMPLSFTWKLKHFLADVEYEKKNKSVFECREPILKNICPQKDLFFPKFLDSDLLQLV